MNGEGPPAMIEEEQADGQRLCPDRRSHREALPIKAASPVPWPYGESGERSPGSHPRYPGVEHRKVINPRHHGRASQHDYLFSPMRSNKTPAHTTHVSRRIFWVMRRRRRRSARDCPNASCPSASPHAGTMERTCSGIRNRKVIANTKSLPLQHLEHRYTAGSLSTSSLFWNTGVSGLPSLIRRCHEDHDGTEEERDAAATAGFK